MESSSNLHLHHHQQELLGGSSSLPSPSFPLGAGIHQWNQDLILNNGDFASNARVILPSSKDFRLSNEIPAPPLITHMFQDLGFHWAGNSASTESYTNNSTNQANLARIKDEYLSETFPNLNEGHRFSSVELDERLLLRTLISSGLEPPSLDPNLSSFRSDQVGSCGRGNFSMVVPSADVSIMNSSSSTSYPISLGMDLLASARFGRSQLCEPVSLSSMGLLGEDTNPFGPTQVSSRCSHSKASSLSRGNNVLEPKASQAAAKKPRLESTRSLCSAPIKVRKEKLGDRIAALQQLVAPFGKTDTASVLMEAIGYIKFLQGQVETLSVPYMTLSNKKLRTSQGESFEDGDEPKPDLSSRGLCLVPLSCTSYVTNENGGVWSPPNYSRTN